MLIPSLFYGTYGETRKACKIFIRKLLKNNSIAELLAEYPLIDTKIDLSARFLLSKDPEDRKSVV